MHREDLSSPLNCGAPDQQSHRMQLMLMLCPVLLARLTIAEEETTNFAKNNDIYGSVEEQLNMVRILSRLLDIREDLLNNKDSLVVNLITGPNISAIS